MKKKIGKRGLGVFLVAAAFIFLALGCAETGPGADGAADTGDQLKLSKVDYVGEVDILNDNTVAVLSIIDINTTINRMSFTLLNSAVGTHDSSSQTGISLESYSIDLDSDDPGAVPLNSLEHVGISGYVGPKNTIEFKDFPVIPPDAKLEYFTKKGTNPVVYNDVVQYNARITVYGVNDFGQDVQVSFQLVLFFGSFVD
jgi:hypothetical protein